MVKLIIVLDINPIKTKEATNELFARCQLLFARCSLLAAYLLWAITQLLVTRATLIYLIDQFFIFSSLMLLKEMRTQGESKISSSCFLISSCLCFE